MVEIERIEEVPRDLVGPSVEFVPFAPTAGRQASDATASVRRVVVEFDETVALQSAEQPTEIAGVDPEAASEIVHGHIAESDFEEQPVDGERAAGVEERLVEDTDAWREGPVEPAQRRDGVVDHFSDFSQLLSHGGTGRRQGHRSAIVGP